MRAVLARPEGGLIAAGHVKVEGGASGLLVALDDGGRELWRRQYGSSGYERFKGAVRLNDGWLLLGTTHDQNTQGWMLYVDARGEQRWERKAGGSSYDVLYSAAVVEDGVVAVGQTSGETDNHGWALKVDFDGEVLWQRRLEGVDLSVRDLGERR